MMKYQPVSVIFSKFSSGLIATHPRPIRLILTSLRLSTFGLTFSNKVFDYQPVNNNGKVSIACIEIGNVDNAGGINIVDLTHLVQYLFNNGPAPIPF